MILIWFVSCISCIQLISAFATFPNVENLDIVYPPQTSPDSFVVGGENAPDGLAPYQCSLQTNKRHFCGCAILSSKWILTAAHCMIYDISNIEVVVGTTNLRNGTRYKVEKEIPHSQHQKPRFSYDIGVMKVVETISFNKYVQPIRLSNQVAPEGEVARLTGWGRLSTNGQIPDQLQVLYVKVVQTEQCRKINGKHVHDSHVCAFSEKGQGACNGDSGGPLVYNDELIGIVNWAYTCAQGFPDAYAKVSYFYDWIVANTESVS